MEFALESLTQIASNVLAFFDTTIPFYAELEYAIDYFNGTEDVLFLIYYAILLMSISDMLNEQANCNVEHNLGVYKLNR